MFVKGVVFLGFKFNKGDFEVKVYFLLLIFEILE